MSRRSGRLSAMAYRDAMISLAMESPRGPTRPGAFAWQLPTRRKLESRRSHLRRCEEYRDRFYSKGGPGHVENV